MTIVTFTQSSYDPDKILNPGIYKAKVKQTKIVNDPQHKDVLHIIWEVEGYAITEKLKICTSDTSKNGFAQSKLRKIATALGQPSIPEKEAGDKITYDVSAFAGRSCGVVISHFVTNKGTTMAQIDRYILENSPKGEAQTVQTETQSMQAESQRSPQTETQGAFKLPEKPESTAGTLDDEIPF